jgi:CRP-like cAMP-binding protein
MAELQFRAGETLFRPGDASDRAFLIEAGEVELLGGSAEQPSRIGVLGPGDVCGEMGLIEERPRRFAARAVTDVRAAAMSRDEFEDLLTRDPARCRRYLKSLFERLRALAHGSELAVVAEQPLAGTVMPRVTIHPLTRRAAETLPDEGLLVTKFPFRIGRAPEANERDSMDLNDLWLLDRMPFHVSRNHASIALTDAGKLVVNDRGSQLGLIVNEEVLGGWKGRLQATLDPGDNTVVIGGRMSPYQFRVSIDPT